MNRRSRRRVARRGRKSQPDDEALEAAQAVVVAGPVNTTGLASLPTELHLEVIRYLPDIDEYMPFPEGAVFSKKYLERSATLFALSQTCRSLRSVFLPLTWQRLDVYACQRALDDLSNLRRIRWQRELATELVRQCEIVTIRDPTLAQYVK